jgi:hypothetical protein
MPKPLRSKLLEEATEALTVTETKTEKEILFELYQELLDRKINSIGDLENLISRS